jgi:peptidoglycan/LPS O-acetylase OafA/YrhL
MQYRKDIQILRGVSVLLVVSYHLEIGAFNSGFLGVDVFFVISGYLMSALYNPNKKLEFFLKRAKRLLPAYFFVTLATLVISALLINPNDYDSVIKQSVFAVFLSSNIGYWFENSYFSKAAFNPLLHLWSLGVEIHFYLMLPIFYWIFAKFRAALPIVLVISLILCFYVVGISTKTSFFMMPLRLWEFLIGFGVGRYTNNNPIVKNNRFSPLGMIAFIIVIAIPMMAVDGEATEFVHGHPGLHALVVCLATGVILVFGLPAFVENTKVATFLEQVGHYSYSIYLVHFPVLTLFLYTPFSGTILKSNSVEQTFLLAGIIIILSVLMYHLIEVPLRRSEKIARWLLMAPVVIIACANLGLMLQKNKFTQQEMQVFQAWEDRSEYRCGKLSRITNLTDISCELTKSIENPSRRVFLVGNSHADSIKSTFVSVAQTLNVSVRFMVDNSPLMPGGISPEGLIKEALNRKIDTIVLNYSPSAVDISSIQKLAKLAKDKSISIAFIMPVPVWGKHIPNALWRNIKYNEPVATMSLDNYRIKNQALNMELSRLTGVGFNTYQVADIFCKNQCQIINDAGNPLYFDEGHLTLSGSELLRGLFYKVITGARSGHQS